MGQRVKIRWIGQGWNFGIGWNSYMEAPPGQNPFNLGSGDDGWWVDSIRLTGAVTTPAAPIVEVTTIPLTTQCPATAAANCNEAAGSSGFNVSFTLAESNPDGVIVAGELITLDASQTLNPGGCADGVPQYRFFGNGSVIQEFSTAASVTLGNATTADLFQVQVRCSSDFSCTTPLVSLTIPCVFPIGTCTPTEVLDSSTPFTFSAASASPPTITGVVPFNLRIAGGNAYFMTDAAYGHSFLRTAALSIGNGLGVGGTDGGLSGSCDGSGNCTIAQVFGNPSPGDVVVTPGGLPASSGACDMNANPAAPACTGAITPSGYSVTDSGIPGLGQIWYYLMDSFCTGACSSNPAVNNPIQGQGGKCFGKAGPSRTGGIGGVTNGSRTFTPDCP
jgi:hypothetical protein